MSALWLTPHGTSPEGRRKEKEKRKEKKEEEKEENKREMKGEKDARRRHKRHNRGGEGEKNGINYEYVFYREKSL